MSGTTRRGGRTEASPSATASGSRESETPKFGVDYVLPCAFHADELEIDTETDGPPGCPDCGKLLNWGRCWFCGSEFLIFGTGGDDVMADAAVTESGDLVCFPCAVEVEREELQEDPDYGDWDPQDA